MKIRVAHILAALATLFSLVGCSCNGPRVIPRGKMAHIYADMLLNCVKFTVKDGASGNAEFTLIVDEITNNEGVPFNASLYQGGSVGIVL